jgi:hypothetical protein
MAEGRTTVVHTLRLTLLLPVARMCLCHINEIYNTVLKRQQDREDRPQCAQQAVSLHHHYQPADTNCFAPLLLLALIVQ